MVKGRLHKRVSRFGETRAGARSDAASSYHRGIWQSRRAAFLKSTPALDEGHEGWDRGPAPENRFKLFHIALFRSWGSGTLGKDWNAYEAQVDGRERRLR